MGSPGRLLVAVDGSSHALHAVRYVAHLCSRTNPEVRLLLILTAVQEEVFWQVPMDEEFKRRMKERYEAHESESRKSAENFLDRCRGILVEAGISGGAIDLAPRPLREGIARDIIAEARQGYDAVVVGRRGLGKAGSILLGSVSGKIVHSLQEMPVWVVGGPVDSKKVLIAVDASSNSQKAVDTVAALLSGSGSEIGLFHAVRGFPPTLGPTYLQTGEELEGQLMEKLKEGIARMFDAYRTRLLEAGVAPEKIRTAYTIGSISRAADILGAARQGGYGTIVMGRRGLSAVRELVMGRVTNKVLNGGEGLAVWVVS